MVDCKSNFEGQFREDMSCRACKVIGSVEDEDHILSCTVLKLDSHNVNFRDVYGSMDQQYIQYVLCMYYVFTIYVFSRHHLINIPLPANV